MLFRSEDRKALREAAKAGDKKGAEAARKELREDRERRQADRKELRRDVQDRKAAAAAKK